MMNSTKKVNQGAELFKTKWIAVERARAVPRREVVFYFIRMMLPLLLSILLFEHGLDFLDRFIE